MLAKMVDPLVSLKQRITLLLEEWDECALRKILATIEMILAMPLSTPLAEVVYCILCFGELFFIIGWRKKLIYSSFWLSFTCMPNDVF